MSRIVDLQEDRLTQNIFFVGVLLLCMIPVTVLLLVVQGFIVLAVVFGVLIAICGILFLVIYKSKMHEAAGQLSFFEDGFYVDDDKYEFSSVRSIEIGKDNSYFGDNASMYLYITDTRGDHRYFVGTRPNSDLNACVLAIKEEIGDRRAEEDGAKPDAYPKTIVFDIGREENKTMMFVFFFAGIVAAIAGIALAVTSDNPTTGITIAALGVPCALITGTLIVTTPKDPIQTVVIWKEGFKINEDAYPFNRNTRVRIGKSEAAMDNLPFKKSLRDSMTIYTITVWTKDMYKTYYAGAERDSEALSAREEVRAALSEEAPWLVKEN